MDPAHGSQRLTGGGGLPPYFMAETFNFICFLWGLLCAWAVIQGLDS